MPDVFLSYNREDAAVARRFAEAFASHGLDVWWDTALKSGEAYDQVTENALRDAKAVVVLWSPRSVVSRWVRAEATLADRYKTLVPVMIEPCERPIMFELTQTAELSHWKGDPGDRTWLAFLADVRRLAHRDKPASALTPVATPTPVEQLLAVLPFDNLSSDSEMQFFSDGVSEDIIQRLCRGAEVKVIGRTSSFQFRGGDKANAPGALHCSHVLDGSIRRAAGRVRIVAHLMEVGSRTTLWSEQYDRSLDDIFAVQDEISEQIATALSKSFRSFSSSPVDPAVYDLYLRTSATTYAPEEQLIRIGLLEVATQRAPHFAEAWGRLAFARAWLRTYQPFATRTPSAIRILAEADRALALDPQNVDALVAKLLTVPPFGHFSEAEALVEQLPEAPTGEAAIMATWHLRSVGQTRKAAEDLDRALLLDALNPMLANSCAVARMSVGRFAEAAPLLEDLLDRVPGNAFPVANLMRAYTFLEDWESLDRLLDPAANRPLGQFHDGVQFFKTKRNPTPKNMKIVRKDFDTHFAKAGSVEISRLVYAAHLGLVDHVYATVDSAQLGPRGTMDDVMGPDGYRTQLLFWDGMPEIRNDPRFVKLCARLGLVEYWLASGKWPDCAGEAAYDFRAECEKYHDYPKDKFFA